jgi:hypothetical protein
MDIPAIYQYYPALPLSELSDLYSAGNNTLANKNIAILSYLPRTLRIHPDFPFTNTYILLLQDTDKVTSITWDVKLFGKGQLKVDPVFAVRGGVNSNRFSLEFRNDIFEANGNIKYDKLKITCKVQKGAEIKELTLEHALIKIINTKEVGLFTGTQSTLAGDPITTNYMINQLADYFPEAQVWNNKLVDVDVTNQHTLWKIVQGIIYDNLLDAQSNFLKTPLFYDLTSYYNLSFEAMVNNNEAEYEGQFTSGICNLPLHILSDVLGPNNQVPDYLNIGTGNKVYSMIVYDQFLAVNTVEDDFLMTIPQKIADSKERLVAAKASARELYHFSQFPKSAIMLTAMLIKYLFECSKKNECKDCKNRGFTWPFLGLDNLKDNQDLLRNTLTHYYNGPTNTIDDFAERAMKVNRLVWSPAVYTIANIQPRIVKAYFAKRVVRRIDVVKNAAGAIVSSEYIFDFERIDNSATRVNDAGAPLARQPDYDSALGHEVFLVVETIGCRGKKLVINVKPAGSAMTGNTNALELGYNNNFSNEFTGTVGDYAALNTTTTGDIDGTQKTKDYLKIDHKDKMIVKVALRPGSSVMMNMWTTGQPGIGIPGLRTNMGEFHIHVRREDNKEVYYGNGERMTAVNGEFLNSNDKYDSAARFRVANYSALEIFQENNPYKVRNNNGVIVDKIGYITNDFVQGISNDTPESPFKKVAYYYHDRLGNVHELGTPLMHKAQPKAHSVWPAPAPGAGATVGAAISFLPFRAVGEHIDAITMQMHDNGTHAQGNSNYAAIVPNAHGWYRNTSNVFSVDLVDADVAQLGYTGPNATHGIDYKKGDVRVLFDFQHTRRRYANPQLFAAVLGALAKLYETRPVLTVITEGFAFQEGSCYPSISHVNGDALDTDYFALAADTQKFIDALIYYGFTRFISGIGMVFNGPAGITFQHGADHQTHLHSGGTGFFNYATVTTINS